MTTRPELPAIPRAATRLAATLALLLLAPPATAQPATDWATVEQDAMWVGAYLEQPVTPRLSLWFDGQWRRMDLGARPQQLLLRPGAYLALAPGVKVGGGYGYIATAPYGGLPQAMPTREHRAWQDLLLSHRAGAVGVSHRFRLEQRWISPRLADGNGPAAYANRIRYRARGSATLGSLAIAGRPVYGFVWDELLMPIGGRRQAFTLGQNRASAGVGFTLGATLAAEVGYMNLYNAYPSRQANEVNHTLWLSWHYTGRPRTR
jgi:hypothetical protein